MEIDHFQGLEDGCLRTGRSGSLPERSRGCSSRSAAIRILETNGVLGTTAHLQTAQRCLKY